MRFNSGMFNKLGNVYRLSANATVDGSGKVDETLDSNWQLVGPRHFNIVPSSSREFLLGDQLRAVVSHQVTTLYDRQSKGFTERFKFVYQGRIFNFAGPGLNVEERNRWISFPANELIVTSPS